MRMEGFVGLGFALVTLLMWSVGDFFIQRSSRQIGIWKSLFAISLFGTVIPLPFVWDRLPTIMEAPQGLVLLATLGLVMICGALFEFEALKRGKLAIVEPMFGVEIPITLGLSIGLGFDRISIVQGLLVLLISIGVILAAFKPKGVRSVRHVLEKGIVLAAIGASAMALTNFLTGVGSRETDPLATIWFINAFATVVSLAFIIARREYTFLSDLKKYYPAILGESIFDNVAWFSFAYSMTLLPISIATAISESYIALAVLLGLHFNAERLSRSQFLGVAVAIGGVVALALTI